MSSLAIIIKGPDKGDGAQSLRCVVVGGKPQVKTSVVSGSARDTYPLEMGGTFSPRPWYLIKALEARGLESCAFLSQGRTKWQWIFNSSVKVLSEAYRRTFYLGQMLTITGYFLKM